MSNLPPLTGAILITNPRTNMGLALQNPNDKRRLNRLSRSADSQQRAAARKALRAQFRAQYGDGWSKNSQAKAAYEQQAAAAGIHPGQMLAHVSSLPRLSGPQAKAYRKQRAAAKRRVAKQMAAQPGYGKGYVTRVLGTHASRYRAKNKKTRMVSVTKHGKATTVFGKARQLRVLDVPAVQSYNATRVGWRSEASSKGQPTRGAASKRLIAHLREQAAMRPKVYGSKAEAQAAFKRDSKKVAQMLKSQPGLSKKEAWAIVKGRGDVDSSMAIANPSFAGLALENGASLAGVKEYGLGYWLPVAASAAAGGGVLFYATPWVQENIYSRIPGSAGTFIYEKIPNLTLSAPLGLAFGLLASKLGGQAGSIAAMVGGGVVAAGGILDAVNWLSSRLGGEDEALAIEESSEEPISLEEAALNGLALENVSSLSGLALENRGHLGALSLENRSALGDGMAFQLAPLSMSDQEFMSMYGQSSLADAQYSGADFDAEEGQAFLNGPQHFTRRFGHPTQRIQQHGGASSGPSHLAGQQGHRWGWLIQAIGFENVRRLCALPPAKRLLILKRMREQALISFRQMLQQAQADLQAANSAPAISSSVPGAPEGAEGAASSFGGVLFAGGEGV